MLMRSRLGEKGKLVRRQTATVDVHAGTASLRFRSPPRSESDDRRKNPDVVIDRRYTNTPPGKQNKSTSHVVKVEHSGTFDGQSRRDIQLNQRSETSHLDPACCQKCCLSAFPGFSASHTQRCCSLQQHQFPHLQH